MLNLLKFCWWQPNLVRTAKNICIKIENNYIVHFTSNILICIFLLQMSFVWQFGLSVLRRKIISRRLLLHRFSWFALWMQISGLPISARQQLQRASIDRQLLLQWRLSHSSEESRETIGALRIFISDLCKNHKSNCQN